MDIEHGTASCEFVVGRAELARFGFADLAAVVATGKGFRHGPPELPDEGTLCDSDTSWRATSIRAFGRRWSPRNWEHPRLAFEIAMRALDVLDGAERWGSSEALQARKRLGDELAACVEFPAGAEIEYAVSRNGRGARPLRIGSPAHSRAEIGCVREALRRAAFPGGQRCDLRVSIYVPAAPREGFRGGAAGLIRVRSRSARSPEVLDVRAPGRQAVMLDPARNVLLLPSGRHVLEVAHRATGERTRLEVDAARGRERTYVVDLHGLK